MTTSSVKPAGAVQMHRYSTLLGKEPGQLLRRAAAILPGKASVARATAVTRICF